MKKPLTLEQLIAKRKELLVFRAKYRRDLDRRTLKDVDRKFSRLDVAIRRKKDREESA